MQIMDLKNVSLWRNRFKRASFRQAAFFVDSDVRGGGRRVALHQYPKRNVPYAEDMGRSANVFHVQGYLIGPNYDMDKDILIGCLEQDGPGMLRLPMPYQGSDVNVMVQSYSVTENREKGGFCQVEMQFVEYGDPAYRPTTASSAQINSSAQNLEANVAAPAGITDAAIDAVQPYSTIYNSANVDVGGGFIANLS